MTATSRLLAAPAWTRDRLQAVLRRLQLTWRGLVWLGAGLLTMAGALAVLVGLGEDVTRHNGAYLTDPTRLGWFVDHRSAAEVSVARLVSSAASIPVLLVLAVVAGLLLWRRRMPLALASAPLVALVVAAGSAAVLKSLVARPRPPVALRLAVETEPSFPSGHSTDAAALGLALALVLAITVFRRPLARAASVALAAVGAAAVGASRLVLGVHWPSDVAAGLALGTAAALAVVVVSAIATRVTPPAEGRRVVRVPLRLAAAVRPPKAALRAAA